MRLANEQLEKLKHQKYVAEKRLTAAKHREKQLQRELKQLTRSERTHRLCTRAGMLETFLREPTLLTDDDVMELLTFVFHGEAVQKKLNMVCSKLLHHEALGRFDEPKSWEIREINEIMNQSVTGWIPYPNPRSYKKYGKQRGWMRGNEVSETGTSPMEGFRELTEEECSQMELPF